MASTTRTLLVATIAVASLSVTTATDVTLLCKEAFDETCPAGKVVFKNGECADLCTADECCFPGSCNTFNQAQCTATQFKGNKCAAATCTVAECCGGPAKASPTTSAGLTCKLYATIGELLEQESPTAQCKSGGDELALGPTSGENPGSSLSAYANPADCWSKQTCSASDKCVRGHQEDKDGFYSFFGGCEKSFTTECTTTSDGAWTCATCATDDCNSGFASQVPIALVAVAGLAASVFA